MALLSFKKLNVLPTTLDPNTAYLLPDTDPTFMNVVVSNDDGSASRKMMSVTEVQALITAALTPVVTQLDNIDLTPNWDTIEGRPTSSASAIDDAVTDSHAHQSTVAQIDAAVVASHEHANKATLDKLTEDVNGVLMFDTQPLRAYLDQVAW